MPTDAFTHTSRKPAASATANPARCASDVARRATNVKAKFVPNRSAPMSPKSKGDQAMSSVNNMAARGISKSAPVASAARAIVRPIEGVAAWMGDVMGRPSVCGVLSPPPA